MMLYFDPHARAMLTYAMNPPGLVRTLDDALERPVTEHTERSMGQPTRSLEEEAPRAWPRRWEPTYG